MVKKQFGIKENMEKCSQFIKSNNHDKAFKCSKVVVKSTPQSGEDYFYQGQAYSFMGIYTNNQLLHKEAIKCYDKAIELNYNLS